VKRRTLAKELCDEGCVLVNGRTARAGHDVDAGDEVTLNLRGRSIEVAVESTPGLYRVIRDEMKPHDDHDDD
jgi:ribosomal 50S subunit-recycling heat shock protein